MWKWRNSPRTYMALGMDSGGCFHKLCGLLTPPAGLKHTFSQLLGVLEAESSHLSAAAAAENTLPRVQFFHWGHPTSNDWPLWGIKACLLSLISDNSEGTVQKRSSLWRELSSEAHPTPAPPCCFQSPLLFNKLPANLYLRLYFLRNLTCDTTHPAITFNSLVENLKQWGKWWKNHSADLQNAAEL